MRALKTTSAPAEASAAGRRARRRWVAGGGRFFNAAISEQALRWPLLVPLAIATGAAFYMTAPTEPSWQALGLTLGLFALAAWATRPLFAGFLSFALLLAAFAATGALAGKIRANAVAAPVIAREIGPVRIEGVLAEIDSSDRSRRLRLHVRAIEGLTPDQTPAFVRFSYRGEIAFAPGRAIGCRAILSPPPDPTVPGDYAFNRDAWFQQLGAVGFSIGACTPLATPPPADAWERFGLWIGALRRAIATHVYESAGEKGGGISAAMIAGDRSFITPEDAEALRVSGLAHLLSISGVHMVLAGGIFFFAIRFTWPLIEPLALRLPAVQVAALGAIIACTLYFAISGAEVATQRAYVMALIAFGAKLFDKPALSLRSLAVAMTVVTLLQPEAVASPGYQMSFAASAALVALYEMWPRIERPEGAGVFSRVWGWVIGATATSLVASFATMPFALHHFERAAIFSVLANLAATPVISFWTTPAAAAAAMASLVGLEEPFFALMGKSLEVVAWIARASADLSPDFDTPRLSTLDMTLAAVAISLFCAFRGRGRLIALIPAAIAIAGWITTPAAVGYVAQDGSVFVKESGRWLELTDWRSENGLNPLAIDEPIVKSGCPGKGAACRVATPSGEFEVIPGPEPASPQASTSDAPGAAQASSGLAPASASDACPTTAALLFRPARSAPVQSTPVQLTPCDLAARGGAVIRLGRKGVTLRLPAAEQGRPWSR